MDKAILTAFMIIVSVVMAVFLFNSVYPAVVQGSASLTSMAHRADDRLRSQIEVIHAVGEIDSGGGWQDVNGNGKFDTFIWVKNVGASRITALERTDVFFGPEGNFTRIPHESEAGGSTPYWNGSLENADEWSPTATLKVTIVYDSPLSSGRYFVKVTTPNGVSDDYYLSM